MGASAPPTAPLPDVAPLGLSGSSRRSLNRGGAQSPAKRAFFILVGLPDRGWEGGEELHRGAFFRQVVRFLWDFGHQVPDRRVAHLQPSDPEGLEVTQYPRHLARFPGQARSNPLRQKTEPHMIAHPIRPSIQPRAHLQKAPQLTQGLLHIERPFGMAHHLLFGVGPRRAVGVERPVPIRTTERNNREAIDRSPPPVQIPPALI